MTWIALGSARYFENPKMRVLLSSLASQVSVVVVYLRAVLISSACWLAHRLVCMSGVDCGRSLPKLQALVYDILPWTTAVFSYAIGSRKMSANEQFFVGAQTVVSLLQTTQIISAVCFITDHVAYASSNKIKIVWTETELFFFFSFLFPPGWMRLMFKCVLGR